MRIDIGWLAIAAMLGAGDFQPARLTESPLHMKVPPLRGQWQTAFEVSVDPAGLVTGVRCLCGSAPLANALEEALACWAFEPATDNGVTTASRVLVAALVRPPALFNVGPCGVPEELLLASPGLPVPVVAKPPTYPVRALGAGVVVVEVEIESSGEVRSARAVGDWTPFDSAAERAAQAWVFVPGRREGRPVPTVAYLLFGFQEPALSPGPD
jgi:TonB family protein